MINMVLGRASISVFIILSAGICRYLIYPWFLSPLSKLPNAHPLSAVTPLWILWVRYCNREIEVVDAAHKKHGLVVRLGLNEVSVNCVDGGIQTIYGGGFEKPQWYSVFTHYGMRNTFSSLDSRAHAMRRRRVSNIYSKSWLQTSEHMNSITTTLLYQRLLPFLAKSAQSTTTVDTLEMSFASGLDFVSAFFFGTSCGTNFIQNEEERKSWLDVYLKAHDYMFWLQELPFLTVWLAKFGINIMPKSSVEASRELESWCLAMCDAAEKALSTLERGKKLPSGELPVVYQQLKITTTKEVEHSGPTHLLTPHTQRLEIASELLDHLIATRDTFGIALTYVILEVSRNPVAQLRLRQELHTLSTPITFPSASQNLPHAKELDSLPFLHAVILESLRLRPNGFASQPRLTPRFTTSKLGPFTDIPPNVRVTAFGWCLHRNPNVFPDPERWHPERWMDDEKVNNRMKGENGKQRWFWAFGSGPRMCMGSHLAMQVIKFVVAGIYTNFTTRVVNMDDFGKGGRYVAGDRGDKLILKFDLV